MPDGLKPDTTVAPAQAAPSDPIGFLRDFVQKRFAPDHNAYKWASQDMPGSQPHPMIDYPMEAMQGMIGVGADTRANRFGQMVAAGIPLAGGMGAVARGTEEALTAPRAMASTPAKAMTPIEEFYANNPTARYGGAGRTTGSWTEGNGGLASVPNMQRYPMPEGPVPTIDTHDNIERPMGKAMQDIARGVEKPRYTPASETRMQELTAKLGGKGPAAGLNKQKFTYDPSLDQAFPKHSQAEKQKFWQMLQTMRPQTVE